MEPLLRIIRHVADWKKRRISKNSIHCNFNLICTNLTKIVWQNHVDASYGKNEITKSNTSAFAGLLVCGINSFGGNYCCAGNHFRTKKFIGWRSIGFIDRKRDPNFCAYCEFMSLLIVFFFLLFEVYNNHSSIALINFIDLSTWRSKQSKTI